LPKWTERDFEQLSWHDNHVHGIRIVGGEDGHGELVLDIDHIVEWQCPPDGSFGFRVAPATLTFHEVMDLCIGIDYSAVTAGIVPPSIGEIVQEKGGSTGDDAQHRWRIKINWPVGEITFAARGFTQVLRAEPVVIGEQCLDPARRE